MGKPRKKKKLPATARYANSWGWAGWFLGLVLAGIGFGFSGRQLLAHWLFFTAFLSGALGCWSFFGKYPRKRAAMTVASISFLLLALFVCDHFVAKSLRAHIHILGVDLLGAAPGEVLKSRTHFQNDGDAPIQKLTNCEGLLILPFSRDVNIEIDIENSIFATMKGSSVCGSIPANVVPAHSIALNSDLSGKTILTPPMLSSVRDGNEAIYLVGSIEYVDNEKARESDYCYYTKGDVDGMKLCLVHNTEP